MGTDREAKLGPVARWRLMPGEPWMERSASGEWVKLDDVRKALSTPPEAPPEPARCVWTKDDGLMHTSCGRVLRARARRAGFNYCPICGQPLVVEAPHA